MDSAASTAPPPGTTVLDSRTRLTTHSASWIDRSISSTMKSLAPRRTMDAADLALVLGEIHRKLEIYSFSNILKLFSNAINYMYYHGNDFQHPSK